MFELLLQPGSERSQKAFGLNYCASSFVTEGQPSVLFSLWFYPVVIQPRHFLKLGWGGVHLAEPTPPRSQERSGTASRRFSGTTSSTLPSPTNKQAPSEKCAALLAPWVLPQAARLETRSCAPRSARSRRCWPFPSWGSACWPSQVTPTPEQWTAFEGALLDYD